MEVFLRQIKLTFSFNTRWEQHRRIFLEIQAHNPIGARQAVRRLMKVTMTETLGCEWSNCSSVSIIRSDLRPR
jgi:DNA-binding FadR family transcriptional regulator